MNLSRCKRQEKTKQLMKHWLKHLEMTTYSYNILGFFSKYFSETLHGSKCTEISRDIFLAWFSLMELL